MSRGGEEHWTNERLSSLQQSLARISAAAPSSSSQHTRPQSANSSSLHSVQSVHSYQITSSGPPVPAVGSSTSHHHHQQQQQQYQQQSFNGHSSPSSSSAYSSSLRPMSSHSTSRPSSSHQSHHQSNISLNDSSTSFNSDNSSMATSGGNESFNTNHHTSTTSTTTTSSTQPQPNYQPPSFTPASAPSESTDGSGPSAKNFQVVIRVRPALARERQDGTNPFQPVLKVHDSGSSLTLSENFAWADQLNTLEGSFVGTYPSHAFSFDQIYGPQATQADVYSSSARDAVMSALHGYNATVMAYGQTGTGKTHTMEGTPQAAGIIPRAIEEVFNYIAYQRATTPGIKFLVRASYLQIYNESISDLLKPDRHHMTIREDKKRGVFVEGLSEWIVRSPEEIYGLMRRGQTMRTTGATKMNVDSSRSHAVFQVIVEQSANVTDSKGNPAHAVKIGKLNLVDLAGSERVRFSGAKGVRLEESKKINQSLSALGNVISALTDPKGRAHIPYRDSKLTRLLEDSLGGNCRTIMMAMVSPALPCLSETLSTLKFAHRAKHVKNVASVNEDLDSKALLAKYEKELKTLRAALQDKSQGVVDKRKLLELEEGRRRAEADRLAAVTHLERLSKEFQAEKAEKRRLEARIQQMERQVLATSSSSSSTPGGQNILDDESYASRVADLEAERATIEEDKAQVDRYKLLLLKQRDIMLTLTTRLNERDETILSMQEAYEDLQSAYRELEETLDQKTAQLIKHERQLVTLQVDAPPDFASSSSSTGSTGSLASDRAAHQVAHGGARMWPADPRAHESSDDLQETLSNGAEAAHRRRMLGAEDKIAELQSLLTSSLESGAAVEKELEEVKAEKVQMESAMRERLEKEISEEIEARVKQYQDDVESWKAAQLKAVRAAQKQLAQKHESVVDKIRTESALQVQSIKDELTRLKAEARSGSSRGADVDALTADIHRLQVANTKLHDSLNMAQARVQLLEESASARPPQELVPVDRGESQDASVTALETQLASLREQQITFKARIKERLEAKNQLLRQYESQNKQLRATIDASAPAKVNKKEVDALRATAAAAEKERGAMLTIMEAKVKTLVDAICDTAQKHVQTSAKPGADPASLTKSAASLRKTALTLQHLVNASISALATPLNNASKI